MKKTLELIFFSTHQRREISNSNSIINMLELFLPAAFGRGTRAACCTGGLGFATHSEILCNNLRAFTAMGWNNVLSVSIRWLFTRGGVFRAPVEGSQMWSTNNVLIWGLGCGALQCVCCQVRLKKSTVHRNASDGC